MSSSRLIIKLFGNDVDVSQWIDRHPGGRKLLKIFEGRDGTQQFVAIHKGDSAMKMLRSLPQSPSKTKPKYNEVELEFNELIKSLEPTLSKVNITYEIMKVLYICGMIICGYLICFIIPDYKYLGLVMMCLSMYQAGWVGHDYSHRSVFKSPKYNNHMADFLGFIQGYSDIWWKSRHNTHLMTTNEIGNDPDVKTEPVFHFFDSVITDKQSLKHIPYQNLFFLVILSLLDVFWRYESIVVCMKPMYHKYMSRLILHYIFVLGLLVYTPVTCLDLCVLSLVRGFMTASIVFANHYPEDRLPYNHKKGLFEQTLYTSRNTTGLLFHFDNGIFRYLFNETSGFLSMQIEHHLVPTWPSGNLMKLRPYIQALAKKHNIPYKETSVVSALYSNIMKLSDISIHQLKEIN